MEGMHGLFPGWTRSAYRSLRTRWLSIGLNHHNFSICKEERKASTLISVVIAVHDSPEVTRRCLKSLECFGGDSEIILVDDGSKLESTRSLLDAARSKKRWRLIRQDRAMGHSRASETGVAAATRPFLCLLNSDTIVTPRTWLGVTRAFELSSDIAVVGPSTSQTVTAQVVPRAMYCRHVWSDSQIWCFAEKYVLKHQNEPVVDLPRVGGFAFFIRRTVWDEMGGFDKLLPDYGNETELCSRLLRLGLRVVWSKASYIHHLGSESYGRTLGLAEIKKRGIDADNYIQSTVKQ
jgi:GT2 family glycosyltransferase